jgi:hypothetical protein
MLCIIGVVNRVRIPAGVMLLKKLNLIVRAVTLRRELRNHKYRAAFMILLYILVFMNERDVGVYVEQFHSILDQCVLPYSLISELDPLIYDISVLNIVLVRGGMRKPKKVNDRGMMYSNKRVLGKKGVKEQEKQEKQRKERKERRKKSEIIKRLDLNKLLRSPVNEVDYQAILNSIEMDLAGGVLRQSERSMFELLKLKIEKLKVLGRCAWVRRLQEWVIVITEGIFSTGYSIWIIISVIYPLVCEELIESKELYLEEEEEEESVDLRWYVKRSSVMMRETVLKTVVNEDAGNDLMEVILVSIVVFCIKNALIYWWNLSTDGGDSSGSLGVELSLIEDVESVTGLDAPILPKLLPGMLYGETGPYSPASLNIFENVIQERAILENEVLSQSSLVVL